MSGMEVPLKGWVVSNEVDGILFDLDDTLIKTSELLQLGAK